MPSFNLEPSFQSVGIDSEASLSIELQRLKEPIFGITMQVNYNSSILSFISVILEISSKSSSGNIKFINSFLISTSFHRL